ncbi:unnamed protein product [Timema podura]|uniref:Uncharacterized protein n=1 Tax=Timema podura TaxID=61482 RepID=A0ABN7PJY1_TIMPD|nr:unnamed protein product [Timema podura]
MHDGTESSVTYREFAKMAVKKALPMSPREFKIKPAEGVVAACSSIRVKLTLVPNLPRMWSTAIVVDMWEASCESVKLPLKYHSMVPRIICHPEEISIRFCFINHPYTRKLMLENCSNIDGFFLLRATESNP